METSFVLHFSVSQKGSCSSQSEDGKADSPDFPAGQLLQPRSSKAHGEIHKKKSNMWPNKYIVKLFFLWNLQFECIFFFSQPTLSLILIAVGHT